MLWSEPASQPAVSGYGGVNDAYTVVKFGEGVYSQIRRFVIVSTPAGKGFVYSWYVSRIIMLY
jgi:hypothetical protein